jgi:hypothetical protein
MQKRSEFRNSHLTESQKLKFRLWLQKRFTDRCGRNPRYSLRAFAESLKKDASSVSQILSGKRAPSKKAVLEICERLSATPRDLKRLGIHSPELQGGDEEGYQLAADTFAVMSDWYHYAILELTFIGGFKSDAKWIAQQLGLSVQEAKSAIERLLRLGLLAEKNGSLVKTHEFVTNHTGLNTSVARKNLQRQVIGKALKAIDDFSQEEKDITSITMAIDPKNLDRARELTKAYRRELCALLEEGEPSRVYNLAIQLYPISKKT